ncbi:MAG TPA: hypothetical protein VFF43_00070, partial [Caldimonas sp.]|nr:hypothetical protein [Caldimonas sp.]
MLVEPRDAIAADVRAFRAIRAAADARVMEFARGGAAARFVGQRRDQRLGGEARDNRDAARPDGRACTHDDARRRSFSARRGGHPIIGRCRSRHVASGDSLMRVVITGGAGFIGSRLAKALVERGSLTDSLGRSR